MLCGESGIPNLKGSTAEEHGGGQTRAKDRNPAQCLDLIF